MYYTYYSFETNKGIDGLGYIGHRQLKSANTPEEELYYGTPSSSKNKEFKDNRSKGKIILGVFETREEAVAHEVYLHELWSVDINEHFANQSKQTSEKFYYSASGEDNPNYGKTGENNPNYGRKHTQESRQRMSEALKGRPLLPETCTKLSESHRGKVLSEEHKGNISKAMAGDRNPFYGQTHTLESRQRMTESLLGRFAGSEHPRYDHTIYLWENECTGAQERLSAFELTNKYNLSKGHINQVKNGKRKSHKGWKLIGAMP